MGGGVECGVEARHVLDVPPAGPGRLDRVQVTGVERGEVHEVSQVGGQFVVDPLGRDVHGAAVHHAVRKLRRRSARPRRSAGRSR